MLFANRELCTTNLDDLLIEMPPEIPAELSVNCVEDILIKDWNVAFIVEAWSLSAKLCEKLESDKQIREL